MNVFAKKLLVLLPVLLLGLLYLYDRQETYRHVRSKRLVFLAISLLLLYGWIFIEVLLKKQRNFYSVITQGSFYVYFFTVLTLTGYFILFREVSSHDWWQKIMERIDR